MQEISDLFSSCREELENSKDDICFELSSDRFVSERDYEEIKILFNLVRISIENPDKKISNNDLLTSDLRKISNTELEKVLIATEKAIDIPVISLSAIKQDNAKKISKFLLAADEKDSTYLFKSHAKKIIPAGLLQRFFSFCIDFLCSTLLACCISFLAVKYYLIELQSQESILPIISLFTANLCAVIILYPLISYLLFKNTFGNTLSRIKITGKNNLKITLSQVFLRYSLFPLAIISLSILNIFFKKDALHDYLAGTQVTK